MTELKVDPAHSAIDPFKEELIQDVWADKYRWKDEPHIGATFARVADAIYTNDREGGHVDDARRAMELGLWMPGGRILAGAGTSKVVTLMNCYVNETLQDSMKGIMQALSTTAITLQQGGGIGSDFSPLRPSGSLLNRTGPGSAASGPIPFMKTWDAASKAVKSAGNRRGAMMGTISDTHPDMPAFVVAKQEPSVLTQFNISVLISDAFMQAIETDDDWYLYFPREPAEERPTDLVELDFDDKDGNTQYVYAVWQARDLWDMITKNTYEYSEPGVIFIDRINDLNNLQHCEEIRCTNPCVTGDTPVLTEYGYININELVGNPIKIWNGKEWVGVTPFETGLQDLMGISFSNGQLLKVTPDHKFFVGGKSVAATDLQPGDKLDWVSMPILDLPPTFAGYTYSQGFYAGDGCINSKHSKLYSTKYACRERLEGTFSAECTNRGIYVNWFHGHMKLKNDVPVNASITECVDWLAGWLDADGAVLKKGRSHVIEGSSKDKEFLDLIVLMLTRLGCNPRMWAGKDSGKKIINGVEGNFVGTFRVMLNMADIWQLKQLGLKCERLSLEVFYKPQGKAFIGQRVINVTEYPDPGFTYCFTEPLQKCGVFNGIATGQCGEQPLPANGTCNLGAVNLARMVNDPFTEDASFNYELLQSVVTIGIRFLDNVIDVTNYPLEAQAEEEKNKRRLGLGISGLGDCLAQMHLEYGSGKSAAVVEQIMRTIAESAYEASALLAQERGSFPLFDKEEIVNAPFVKKLPKHLRDMIYELGLRNGVLLTIAPTGTTSLVFGNMSSGLEPVFRHSSDRKVFQADDTWKEYKEVPGYGYLLYKTVQGDTPINKLPAFMVTAKDLSVDGHLRILAACQKWVDASVSKTINLPEDIEFEEFQAVYTKAYSMGCKGCTTYRPSDIRGSVLSDPNAREDDAEVIPDRPECLEGSTYKIKWPSWTSAVYVTVNHDEDGRPFEVFIQSKDARHQEWITALTIMISAIMRRGGDVRFIPGELKQVHSTHDSSWTNGRFYGSLVSRIGDVLEYHYGKIGLIDTHDGAPVVMPNVKGSLCPSCGAPALFAEEGCKKCHSCGYTQCG